MTINKFLSAIMLAALFVGCSASSRPTLYPNQFYQDAGEVQVDVDLKYCMTIADNYVKEPSKYQKMAESGLISGAIGAGAGALTGTIVGSNIGRATGAGAAVGAIVAIASELVRSGDRSPSYRSFVEHCLLKKGYEVTGWN